MFTRSGPTWSQEGSKLTANDEAGGGAFGTSVALSSDGNTALIGGFSDGGGFLARTFEHTVVRELGLDRYPELRDDYFRNYTRVLWLAQRPTAATRAAAERAAARIGLPMEERAVGSSGLERQLERLVTAPPHSGLRRSTPRR